MSDKMKVLVVALMAGLCCACGGEESHQNQIACAIISPAEGVLLGGDVEVRVAVAGPVARVQLLTDGRNVAERAVASGQETVTLTWASGEAPDGPVQLVARVILDENIEARSEPVGVELDNTKPKVSFGPALPRMSVVAGEVVVPLLIDEANPASVRVVDREYQQELLSGQEVVTQFTWDTGTSEEGIHHLVLEVSDTVGNSARTVDLPLVVANTGAEVECQYLEGTEIFIPENWQSAEFHLKASATSEPGITRVISWFTWDATAGWEMAYDVGQGLCPHHGIAYVRAESDSGEIVIDLSREDLTPDVVARLPEEDRDSDTFPYNTDVRTFGAFFGHVVPLDPQDHVNETLPIEIRFVFFYK